MLNQFGSLAFLNHIEILIVYLLYLYRRVNDVLHIFITFNFRVHLAVHSMRRGNGTNLLFTHLFRLRQHILSLEELNELDIFQRNVDNM